ncbi:transcriptional regulator, Cro/CI family [Moritella sp. PE36]|nr:transcriptional regulator, Cro/CI family [Moritella sp. PE36]
MSERLTLQIISGMGATSMSATEVKKTNSAGRNAIVSKRINLSREEREALVIEVTVNMLKSTMTKGEALKYLRLNLFSVNQADYAKMVGICRKVLSEIENGKGNYTEAILQKAFRPLGMVVTVMPRNLAILDKARSAC